MCAKKVARTYKERENVLKLDGVGPVENRPSTNYLHTFVQFLFRNIFLYKKLTCDR